MVWQSIINDSPSSLKIASQCHLCYILPEISINIYSIAVPADTYFNGTVIINKFLTILSWNSILNSNGIIPGYGYSSFANRHYTILDIVILMTRYMSLSMHEFYCYWCYRYLVGMLLQSIINNSVNVTTTIIMPFFFCYNITYHYCINSHHQFFYHYILAIGGVICGLIFVSKLLVYSMPIVMYNMDANILMYLSCMNIKIHAYLHNML